MNHTLAYIIFAVIALTLLVLISGVVLMSLGNKANKKYSNKLMMLRVILQALAIFLLMIAAFLYGS